MSNRVNMLTEPKAVELIQSYGIPYPSNKFVTSAVEAIEALKTLKSPVVMKIVSKDIVHKSDAGGVKVNLKTAEDVENAYEEILANAKKYNKDAEIEGVFICEMADKGEEVIIGIVVDDIFGPTIMFGLGGIFVEVLKDVTFRVCPIDKSEALEMMKEIKGYKILQGTRGQAALDIDSLAELLSNISRLAVERKDISEIDFNPVRVYEKGVKVLDARIICNG